MKNNNIVKEEKVMKELSVKELSVLVNVSEGSIRSWIMRGEVGEVYDSSKVNYKCLRRSLLRLFGDFKERFGFDVEDIVIVKRERSKREYVKVEELEKGDEIVLWNYSLRSELKLIEIVYDGEEKVYVFRGEKGYKSYGESELMKECMKIERK